VADQRAVAFAACSALGLHVRAMKAQSLPTAPGELDSLLRLWGREAILSGAALLLECHDVDASDATRAAALDRLIEWLGSPLLIRGAERRRVRQATTLTFDVRRPTTREQRTLWRQVLSEKAAPMNGELDALAAQFDLTPRKVQAASAEAASLPG